MTRRYLDTLGAIAPQAPGSGFQVLPRYLDTSILRYSFSPNWGKNYAHEKPPLWEWPQPPPPEALDWVPDEENMDMSFSGFGSPHSGHLSPDPSSVLFVRVSNSWLHFLHLNSYMGMMGTFQSVYVTRYLCNKVTT